MQEKMIRSYTISQKEECMRLDLFLGKKFTYRSRNYWKNAIKNGQIIVGTNSVQPDYTLKLHDEILFHTDKTEEQPVDTQIEILYEDEILLVVDKPGNLPVHPAGRYYENTLYGVLRNLGYEKFHFINRLDRETSGIVLLTKTVESAGIYGKIMMERNVKKEYFAICKNKPEQKHFFIREDLGEATGSEIRKKRAVVPKGSGENAESEIWVLHEKQNHSLLKVRLHTGRTHQIRTHLEWAGLPIVGDKIYGGDESLFLNFIENGMSEENLLEAGHFRQALHASFLEFPDPYHNGMLRHIESKLPKDLQALLERLE